MILIRVFDAKQTRFREKRKQKRNLVSVRRDRAVSTVFVGEPILKKFHERRVITRISRFLRGFESPFAGCVRFVRTTVAPCRFYSVCGQGVRKIGARCTPGLNDSVYRRCTDRAFRLPIGGTKLVICTLPIGSWNALSALCASVWPVNRAASRPETPFMRLVTDVQTRAGSSCKILWLNRWILVIRNFLFIICCNTVYGYLYSCYCFVQ